MKMSCVRAVFTLMEMPAVNARKRMAFTLIELLVVIAIIGILAAILLPVMKAAFRKAEIAQAQTEVRALSVAWKNYYSEYHVWPVELANNRCLGQAAGEDGMNNESDGIQVTRDILALLTGGLSPIDNYIPAVHNAKHISFLDISAVATSSTGAFVDPWGNPYKFLFDINYDSWTILTIPSPQGTRVSGPVMVWSRGPDGADITANEQKDDLRSW